MEEELILRSVRDERDVERYIAFNRDVNGEAEGAAATRLLRYHPEARREDFWFVEDERTGQVVSTTCLIPWLCRYEDIPLRVAMLEMVVTHPQYRQRGLVRTQVARFHQVVAERGYELSIIQGIPYYYRQYGYAYALDHTGADALPLCRIPAPEALPPGPYSLREATDDDTPVLSRLYDEAMAAMQIRVIRSPDLSRYLHHHVLRPLQVLEDRYAGKAVGYIATQPMEGGTGTRVIESAIPGMEAAWAALMALRERGGQEMTLAWPQSGALVQLGRSLGSLPLPSYQWLWRMTDVVAFLTRIAQVLDRRLADAGCSGLTTDILINLYREAFRARIQAGRVAGMERAGFVDASMGADGGDLCIPPEAFVRLILGYRTLDELRDAWPDIVIKAKSHYLFDILFPKMASCIQMPY